MLNYVFRDGLPSPQNFAGLEAVANLVKLRSPKGNKSMKDVEKRFVRELRRQILGLSNSIPSMPRPSGEDTQLRPISDIPTQTMPRSTHPFIQAMWNIHPRSRRRSPLPTQWRHHARRLAPSSWSRSVARHVTNTTAWLHSRNLCSKLVVAHAIRRAVNGPQGWNL